MAGHPLYSVFHVSSLCMLWFCHVDFDALYLALLVGKSLEKNPFCFLNYNSELLLVGINYDEQTKTHTCKIERFKK